MEIKFTTTELENSIDYLEKALFYFKNIDDSHRFKWLIISLYGALYGFGVLAIKGTNPINRVYDELQLKRKKKEQLMELIKNLYGEIDERYQLMYAKLYEGKLISIHEVIRRCESEEYMKQFTDSKVLKLNEFQREAIGKLVYYRNQFIHYKPMVLGYVGNYEEEIVFPTIQVIEFLALKSNNVFYLKETQRKKVENLLEQFFS
jgi:hypothetical protein